MKRTITLSFILLVSVLVPINQQSAHATGWLGSTTKNWIDCATGSRPTECIDSIEFSDRNAEVRDASTGALDYTSVKWIKTTFEKNKKFEYGKLWDNLVRSDDGCDSYGNGDYFPDGCYTAKGIKSDGGDITFHMQLEEWGDSLNLIQWVNKGEDNPAVREDGWKAITVPVGSTWRVTLKSNQLAQKLGWTQSNTKNPRINIYKGSDGISRIELTGTVYPSFGGCNVTGEKKPVTTTDQEWCAKPDTYAETMSTGLSIHMMPYAYTTAAMAGSAAGGVVISSNGQMSEVRFDQAQGVLTVPMFGPHFEFDKKTINKGWMETSIKGDVVRKAFHLDPATAGNFAKVEVADNNGVADVATYNLRYLKDIDTIEIRAYNFHYSAPTVKITLGKPASVLPSKPKATTIKCAKGTVVKSVTGINPKCPSGYKKK